MQFTFAAATAAETGALVVGATEGAELLGAAARADRTSRGAITRALEASRFKGKPGQMVGLWLRDSAGLIKRLSDPYVS